MLETSPRILTVKQFNELVNTVLNTQIGEVSISGEVSGYQVRQGKWVSFDLKDKDSVVNCFMAIYQLDLPLADGQQIVVTGTPRVYIPYGKLSLTVRSVELTGEGALKKAYEELKIKLQAEGLFDTAHKRPLPRFPETVGIITSGEGAAINDILKVMNGRWGGLSITLLPVVVQGKNAPDELVGALNYFNQQHPVDVIIFGRGGGSLEDLQAFNSERVARAIFSSRIPIVSGIGHEHNTSIADLVADVRAATPSNAAEIAIPDRKTIEHQIQLLVTKSDRLVQHRILQTQQEVRQSMQSLQLFITNRVHDIRFLIQRLYQKIDDQLTSLTHQKREIALLQEKIGLAMKNRLQLKEQRLAELKKLLDVLNPTGILNRGYSITYNAFTNKPITKLDDLPRDGKIKTQVSDGSFETTLLPTQNQASLF